jgi:hypothetical protein
MAFEARRSPLPIITHTTPPRPAGSLPYSGEEKQRSGRFVPRLVISDAGGYSPGRRFGTISGEARSRPPSLPRNKSLRTEGPVRTSRESISAMPPG